MLFSGSVISGLAFATLGALLIPPLRVMLAQKTDIELPTWLRIVIGVLLFFAGMASVPEVPEEAVATPIDSNSRGAGDVAVTPSLPNNDASDFAVPQRGVVERVANERALELPNLPTEAGVPEQHCIRKNLSNQSREAMKLYDELHSFKNDTHFLDMGFSRAGPYYQWLTRANTLEESITGAAMWDLHDEIGIFPGDLAMLGISYVTHSNAGVSEIRRLETQIKESLERTLCVESGSSIAAMIEAGMEARQNYVSPVDRAPADADELDTEVINPCFQAVIDANPELRGEITPWALRNLYPERIETAVSVMRHAWTTYAKPIWIDAGQTENAKRILFKHLRDNCIAGVRGETALEISNEDLLELVR